jgi:hypothetical protein
MRILLVMPLLLVGACNVERDKANDTTTVTFNEAAAQNTAADVGNKVENIAADVGNEAQNLGDKARNTDLDVKVDKDVKTENKSN